jgi:uncharacterized protein (UPF0332 family)
MARKELILEHLKKAEHKLVSARTEFDEKLYEEAVGAAYYAMFHAAKAVLLSKDISPKTHKGVITELGREFIDSFESGAIASVSWGLERRIKADYDVLFEPDKSEALEAISKAEAFIKEAKRVLKLKR